MKVIIFGTGSAAESILNEIDYSQVEVVFISDNNRDKWWGIWNDYKIIPPSEISSVDFDYILIASSFTEEISDSLIKFGISRNKIIPLFENVNENKRKADISYIRSNIFKTNTSNKLALVSRRNSGCNSLALYKNVAPKYSGTVDLITLDEFREKKKEYKISITTSFEARYCRTPINIETWHGFPVKAIGALEKNLVDNITNTNEGITQIISYSNFYSFVMSSIYKIDFEKFIVTGMPRNDLLTNKDARLNISKMLNKDFQDEKLIFYVPTFRNRKEKKVRDGENLNNNNNDYKKINEFLSSNNHFLIIKKHPIENDDVNLDEYTNIFFVDDNDFKEHSLDFYEVLGASDMLITDYSSVYIDYLLLDRPIIYWMKDKAQYEENRGFLFENVEELMPGPHVSDVEEVIEWIHKLFENNKLYEAERNHIKNITHKYHDFNSSSRVWDLIISNSL